MKLKGHAKFEEKLACGSENDTRNLKKSSSEHFKVSKLVLYGIILSKVENA